MPRIQSALLRLVELGLLFLDQTYFSIAGFGPPPARGNSLRPDTDLRGRRRRRRREEDQARRWDFSSFSGFPSLEHPRRVYVDLGCSQGSQGR